MKTLKQIRTKNNLSIAEMSRRTGYSRMFIKRCEETKHVSFNKLNMYAEKLNCRFDVLEENEYKVRFEHSENGLKRIIFEFNDSYSLIINLFNKVAYIEKDGLFIEKVNFQYLNNLENLYSFVKGFAINKAKK